MNSLAVNNLKHQKAFTLIEVMVAVAILALALPAMLYALMNQIDNTGYMRDKMFAQWVAEDVLAEIRFENKRTGNVPVKGSKGEAELGGRKWYWRSNAIQSENELFKDLYTLEIRVFDDPDDEDLNTLYMVSAGLRRAVNKVINRGAIETYTYNSDEGNNQGDQNETGSQGGTNNPDAQGGSDNESDDEGNS